MAEQTNPEPKANAKSSESQPAAKAAQKGGKVKPPKPPAVEDKPFAEFMHQDYLPALKEALEKEGAENVDVKVVKQRVPMSGSTGECWQVIGGWGSDKRQFTVYFPKADIKGTRGFSCSANGTQPSTIEPFLIDERKITLKLLVFGVIQRLNAQKWLTPN